ncbi:MAG: hypothetical protein CL950_11980 [Erythrobacter sp.]|nr:hypothetical protein [Erythrobacter sp.]|tara:strand:+ start:2316 stop:3725 length:1410 start_codon:yes stop_codon:yes gene_type:complete
MLDQDQVKLLEQARATFKTVSVEGHTPFDDRSFAAFLQSHDLTSVTVFFHESRIAGFSKNGRAQINALARSLRTANPSQMRVVTNAVLADMLTKMLTQMLSGRADGELTSAEVKAFDEGLVAWFKSLAIARTHYIPCIISPWPGASFTVGPVRFYHRSDFPVADFGMTSAQFDALTDAVDLNDLNGLKTFMTERHADWIAVVGVYGHEPAQARVTADLTVDVALAIVQLLTPIDQYRQVSRCTARTAPAWRIDVVLTSDGGGAGGRSNNQPGRGVAPDGLGTILAAQDRELQSMGGRLAGYLDGSSELPSLDETWCNAAYWYHEAIAEPLETVAIAKLETAIEVLFRSVSSSGSNKRLTDSLEIFFGLQKDDLLPNGEMTAAEFAAAIVTARSRVLHGTWQTLIPDLPVGKGGKTISLRAAEQFARLLLVEFSLGLDHYGGSADPIDEVEPFLDWFRTTSAPSTPPAVS